MENFYNHLFNRLLEVKGGPHFRGGHSASVPRGKTPAGFAAAEKPGDARVAAMQALVGKHFDANPDAEGAGEYVKKGPDWVMNDPVGQRKKKKKKVEEGSGGEKRLKRVAKALKKQSDKQTDIQFDWNREGESPSDRDARIAAARAKGADIHQHALRVHGRMGVKSAEQEWRPTARKHRWGKYAPNKSKIARNVKRAEDRETSISKGTLAQYIGRPSRRDL